MWLCPLTSEITFTESHYLQLYHPKTTSSNWIRTAPHPSWLPMETWFWQSQMYFRATFLHVMLEKHTFSLVRNSVDTWKRGNPSKGTRLPNVSEIWSQPCSVWVSLVAQLVKKSTCNAGDLGSIPRLGRSPGEGKCYPFQYSGLENSMDCIVRGVAKTWTRLSYFHFHVQFTTVFLDY